MATNPIFSAFGAGDPDPKKKKKQSGLFERIQEALSAYAQNTAFGAKELGGEVVEAITNTAAALQGTPQAPVRPDHIPEAAWSTLNPADMARLAQANQALGGTEGVQRRVEAAEPFAKAASKGAVEAGQFVGEALKGTAEVLPPLDPISLATVGAADSSDILAPVHKAAQKGAAKAAPALAGQVAEAQQAADAGHTDVPMGDALRKVPADIAKRLARFAELPEDQLPEGLPKTGFGTELATDVLLTVLIPQYKGKLWQRALGYGAEEVALEGVLPHEDLQGLPVEQRLALAGIGGAAGGAALEKLLPAAFKAAPEVATAAAKIAGFDLDNMPIGTALQQGKLMGAEEAVEHPLAAAATAAGGLAGGATVAGALEDQEAPESAALAALTPASRKSIANMLKMPEWTPDQVIKARNYLLQDLGVDDPNAPPTLQRGESRGEVNPELAARVKKMREPELREIFSSLAEEAPEEGEQPVRYIVGPAIADEHGNPIYSKPIEEIGEGIAGHYRTYTDGVVEGKIPHGIEDYDTGNTGLTALEGMGRVGFIDNLGNFVTREDALNIAIEAKQLASDVDPTTRYGLGKKGLGARPMLLSEDLRSYSDPNAELTPESLAAKTARILGYTPSDGAAVNELQYIVDEAIRLAQNGRLGPGTSEMVELQRNFLSYSLPNRGNEVAAWTQLLDNARKLAQEAPILGSVEQVAKQKFDIIPSGAPPKATMYILPNGERLGDMGAAGAGIGVGARGVGFVGRTRDHSEIAEAFGRPGRDPGAIGEFLDRGNIRVSHLADWANFQLGTPKPTRQQISTMREQVLSGHFSDVILEVELNVPDVGRRVEYVQGQPEEFDNLLRQLADKVGWSALGAAAVAGGMATDNEESMAAIPLMFGRSRKGKFYSKLQEVLEKAPQKMSEADWRTWLKKQGVAEEEIATLEPVFKAVRDREASMPTYKRGRKKTPTVDPMEVKLGAKKNQHVITKTELFEVLEYSPRTGTKANHGGDSLREEWDSVARNLYRMIGSVEGKTMKLAAQILGPNNATREASFAGDIASAIRADAMSAAGSAARYAMDKDPNATHLWQERIQRTVDNVIEKLRTRTEVIMPSQMSEIYRLVSDMYNAQSKLKTVEELVAFYSNSPQYTSSGHRLAGGENYREKVFNYGYSWTRLSREKEWLERALTDVYGEGRLLWPEAQLKRLESIEEAMDEIVELDPDVKLELDDVGATEPWKQPREAIHFGVSQSGVRLGRRQLGWIRTQDHKTVTGEKIHFVENLQSELHAIGEQLGYEDGSAKKVAERFKREAREKGESYLRAALYDELAASDAPLAHYARHSGADRVAARERRTTEEILSLWMESAETRTHVSLPSPTEVYQALKSLINEGHGELAAKSPYVKQLHHQGGVVGNSLDVTPEYFVDQNAINAAYDAVVEARRKLNIKPAPDLPFKGMNWRNLILADELLDTAEQGYDYFALINDQQMGWRWAENNPEGFYKKSFDAFIRYLKKHGFDPEVVELYPEGVLRYNKGRISPPGGRAGTDNIGGSHAKEIYGKIEWEGEFPTHKELGELRKALLSDLEYGAMAGMSGDDLLRVEARNDAAEAIRTLIGLENYFGRHPLHNWVKLLEYALQAGEVTPLQLERLSQAMGGKITFPNLEKNKAIVMTPELRKALLEKGLPIMGLMGIMAGSSYFDYAGEDVTKAMSLMGVPRFRGNFLGWIDNVIPRLMRNRPLGQDILEKIPQMDGPSLMKLGGQAAKRLRTTGNPDLLKSVAARVGELVGKNPELEIGRTSDLHQIGIAYTNFIKRNVPQLANPSVLKADIQDLASGKEVVLNHDRVRMVLDSVPDEELQTFLPLAVELAEKTRNRRLLQWLAEAVAARSGVPASEVANISKLALPDAEKAVANLLGMQKIDRDVTKSWAQQNRHILTNPTSRALPKDLDARLRKAELHELEELAALAEERWAASFKPGVGQARATMLHERLAEEVWARYGGYVPNPAHYVDEAADPHTKHKLLQEIIDAGLGLASEKQVPAVGARWNDLKSKFAPGGNLEDVSKYGLSQLTVNEYDELLEIALQRFSTPGLDLDAREEGLRKLLDTLIFRGYHEKVKYPRKKKLLANENELGSRRAFFETRINRALDEMADDPTSANTQWGFREGSASVGGVVLAGLTAAALLPYLADKEPGDYWKPLAVFAALGMAGKGRWSDETIMELVERTRELLNEAHATRDKSAIEAFERSLSELEALAAQKGIEIPTEESDRFGNPLMALISVRTMVQPSHIPRVIRYVKEDPQALREIWWAAEQRHAAQIQMGFSPEHPDLMEVVLRALKHVMGEDFNMAGDWDGLSNLPHGISKAYPTQIREAYKTLFEEAVAKLKIDSDPTIRPWADKIEKPGEDLSDLDVGTLSLPGLHEAIDHAIVRITETFYKNRLVGADYNNPEKLERVAAEFRDALGVLERFYAEIRDRAWSEKGLVVRDIKEALEFPIGDDINVDLILNEGVHYFVDMASATAGHVDEIFRAMGGSKNWVGMERHMNLQQAQSMLYSQSVMFTPMMQTKLDEVLSQQSETSLVTLLEIANKRLMFSANNAKAINQLPAPEKALHGLRVLAGHVFRFLGGASSLPSLTELRRSPLEEAKLLTHFIIEGIRSKYGDIDLPTDLLLGLAAVGIMSQEDPEMGAPVLMAMATPGKPGKGLSKEAIEISRKLLKSLQDSAADDAAPAFDADVAAKALDRNVLPDRKNPLSPGDEVREGEAWPYGLDANDMIPTETDALRKWLLDENGFPVIKHSDEKFDLWRAKLIARSTPAPWKLDEVQGRFEDGMSELEKLNEQGLVPEWYYKQAKQDWRTWRMQKKRAATIIERLDAGGETKTAGADKRVTQALEKADKLYREGKIDRRDLRHIVARADEAYKKKGSLPGMQPGEISPDLLKILSDVSAFAVLSGVAFGSDDGAPFEDLATLGVYLTGVRLAGHVLTRTVPAKLDPSGMGYDPSRPGYETVRIAGHAAQRALETSFTEFNKIAGRGGKAEAKKAMRYLFNGYGLEESFRAIVRQARADVLRQRAETEKVIARYKDQLDPEQAKVLEQVLQGNESYLRLRNLLTDETAPIFHRFSALAQKIGGAGLDPEKAQDVRRFHEEVVMGELLDSVYANKDWWRAARAPRMTEEQIKDRAIANLREKYGSPIFPEALEKEMGRIRAGLEREGLDGYVLLPRELNRGVMEGKYVRQDIAEELERLYDMPNRIRAHGRFLTWLNTVWKRFHTIDNPGTHATNIVSNMMIGELSGALPLLTGNGSVYLGSAMKKLHKYVRLVNAGDEAALSKWLESSDGEMVRRALAAGVMEVDTRFVNEFERVFKHLSEADRGEGEAWIRNFMLKTLTVTRLNKLKAIPNFNARMYQAEEEAFKLAAFMRTVDTEQVAVKRGLRKAGDDTDGAAVAHRWWFDYSDVSPLIDDLRTKWYGAPFITWSYKMAPAWIEMSMEHPYRMLFMLGMMGGVFSTILPEIDTSDAPLWLKGIDVVYEALRGFGGQEELPPEASRPRYARARFPGDVQEVNVRKDGQTPRTLNVGKYIPFPSVLPDQNTLAGDVTLPELLTSTGLGGNPLFTGAAELLTRQNIEFGEPREQISPRNAPASYSLKEWAKNQAKDFGPPLVGGRAFDKIFNPSDYDREDPMGLRIAEALLGTNFSPELTPDRIERNTAFNLKNEIERRTNHLQAEIRKAMERGDMQRAEALQGQVQAIVEQLFESSGM